MEGLLAEYPRVYWAIEKLVGSLFLCLFAWCARGCWRTARANQKLALGDAMDYNERRGLLLPVSSQGRR